jgi:hypothetical protein
MYWQAMLNQKKVACNLSFNAHPKEQMHTISCFTYGGIYISCCWSQTRFDKILVRKIYSRLRFFDPLGLTPDFFPSRNGFRNPSLWQQGILPERNKDILFGQCDTAHSFVE